ncbi:MAG: hypothetical protein KOO62_00920 [candidate division Zixibacteria bacterium]|nr:hypothetical protein [candidate division Zixibacteria bacterium]
MTRGTLRNIILSTLITVMVAPVLAQDGAMIAKLEDELQRTDEVIDRARELVQGTNSAKASLALDQANELQARAWNRFRARRNRIDLETAANLTFKARERAQVALSVARRTAQNEDVVVRELEHVEDLLERARECAAQTTGSSLKTLHQSARENLNQAWQLYRTGRHQASLKLATQIKNSVRKFLQNCQRRSNEATRYDHWTESVGELLNRAQEMASGCDSESADQLLDQALKALRLSKRLADEGKYKAAEEAVLSARTMARKAVRLCQGTDQMENRYIELGDRIDRLAENVSPSDDVARLLLDQARQQLQLAREHLNEDRGKAATAALKAAQMTIGRLQQHLDGTDKL